MPTCFATARIDPDAPNALPPRTGARLRHQGSPRGPSHGSRRLAACTTAVCTQRHRGCGTYAAHGGHYSTHQSPTNAGHTEKCPFVDIAGLERKEVHGTLCAYCLPLLPVPVDQRRLCPT